MFNIFKKEKKKDAFLNSISYKYNNKLIRLVPIGNWIFNENEIIKKINKYRFINNKFFLNEIDRNIAKTNNFLKKIIKDKNMCLFLISSNHKIFYGVIGLKKKLNNMEIYFVLKLRKNKLFYISILKSIRWVVRVFSIKSFFVSVFSNNSKAKKLYYKCGFKDSSKKFLKKIKNHGLYKHKFVLKKNSNVGYHYQTLTLKR